jgi:hypothetical protein
MVLDMKFFDVYHFCHLANSSMGKFEYMRTNAEFMERQFEIEPEDFPKISVLHGYCYWLVERVLYEQANYISNDWDYDFNPALWICQAILKYKEKNVSFDDWVNNLYRAEDNNSDFYEIFTEFVRFIDDEHDGLFADIISFIAVEVEYILLQNREFLLNFNEVIAGRFESDTIPRKYIPEWVKRAVLFRDKGCCVFCKKDLTGLNTLLEDNEKHFDHIVPLKNGGINDVCNIQLSCKNCNQSKLTKSKTSSQYQRAY